MFKIFSLLVFLFLNSSPVLAASFLENGDISVNRYFDTLAFGINSLPSTGDCPNCIEYDLDKVGGTFTKEILPSINIDQLTEKDLKYGIYRKLGVYDNVGLPPYSLIDLIYVFSNEEEEEVNNSSLNVFLTRNDSYSGDLRKVLYVESMKENMFLKYLGYTFLRDGYFKRYEGVGLVNSGSRGSIVLDTLYVKPALEFVKWEADVIDEKVLLRVYVKNISSELLSNIVFSHSEYSYVRDFLPNEEYMYEYVLENVREDSLGYANLKDPNILQECSVVGEPFDSIGIGNSVILVGKRGENAYVGSRSKPYGESFCIARIPYVLHSEEILLNISPISEEKKEVVNEEIPSSEVLGAKILPKTGTFNNNFLVVFSILWYYLFRRRYMYESKIYNSDVCTKSSKDSFKRRI